MSQDSSVNVTIAFNDPELNAEEIEEQALQLMAELRQMDDCDAVGRVLDPNPPEKSKAIGGTLIGLLTADVNIANAQKFISFLGNYLGGKPIELAVEANGKKLTVSAHSPEELAVAIQAAKEFIEM